MDIVKSAVEQDTIRISLIGHIDSGNAADVESEVSSCVDAAPGLPIVVDAEKLEYISSAGLRILLRLRKKSPDLSIINVSSEVYEILDMTGFTEMMTVEKAYKTVSIDGCEVIGTGSNGTIYRINKDNVVKVYNNADALDDIRHEREVARKALVLGIPTAISYDIVKVGEHYGSVFELLNAKSFSKILATEPDKFEWCAEEFVKLLKKIHATEVPEGQLRSINSTVEKWADFTKDYLPEDVGQKLVAMISAVPEDNHMIHGDYHTKNVELVGDEVLLIDMDTLAVGNPIFEFGSIYNAFIGFSEYNHEQVMRFQGFDYDTAFRFWRETVRLYLGTDDEEQIRSLEDRSRIIGYTRLIRRSIRRNDTSNPRIREELEMWKSELIDLVKKYDSLI
ncbi:MAG: anti-sigma factor antagonist [Clostridiales bacterium]|nr:anti-sigma factor antagonist [Clostridiales bacterium]